MPPSICKRRLNAFPESPRDERRGVFVADDLRRAGRCPFQNFAPVFVAALSGAIAVVLTATKTGQFWLWPCALLLNHSWNLARRADAPVRAAYLGVSAGTGGGMGAAPCSKWGAVLYAAALGLWCTVALLGTDDFVARICSVRR